MDNTPHSKYTRKERMRTIGTTDSYDLNPPDSLYNQQNKQRNGSHMKTLSRNKGNKRMENTANRHSKSLSSAFVRSRVQEGTPKCKGKRMMSITQDGRLRTEHSERQQGPGFKKMVSELRKKLIFPSEDTYKLQAFKILKMVHTRSDEQFYTAKSGHPDKKYTLIKTNDSKIRHYARQFKAFDEISKAMSHKDTIFFLKIEHIWREKKHCLAATENYLNANWKEDKFYLFLNQFKTNGDLLVGLMQQIAAAVFILAKNQRVHGRLGLQSVYFPLCKGNLKASGLVKLGNLSFGFKIECKTEFKKMPISYYTPPEILNFILFEEGESFDRDYLEVISDLKEAWQVDIWSLGILLLQLLNGGPLAGSDSDCHQLVQLQRELLIRYSYLLERLEPKMHLCLSNMLSFNPRNRPHPLTLLRFVPEE